MWGCGTHPPLLIPSHRDSRPFAVPFRPPNRLSAAVPRHCHQLSANRPVQNSSQPLTSCHSGSTASPPSLQLKEIDTPDRVLEVFASAQARTTEKEDLQDPTIIMLGAPNHTEIIVIRHGETEWNKEGRIQGHLDVELNEIGREQARAVADRLSREPKISAVYSSDLKRALETAETIAQSCGGLEVFQDPGLRERHLGQIQGLLYSQVSKSKTHSKAYRAMVSHSDDEEIPGGGESLDQLRQRCASSLKRIAKSHRGERVVVVSHGGTIRALCRLASSSTNGHPVGKILNTSVSVFHFYGDDGDEEQWTIKCWGDVSHLEDAGYLKSGFGGDKNSG